MNERHKHSSWSAALSYLGRPFKWRAQDKVAGVALLAAAGVFVGALIWALVGSGGPITYRTGASKTVGALELRLTIDKAAFAQGEPVNLTLTETNTSDAPITLYFRNGQRYDFSIYSYANALARPCFGCAPVWTWSFGRAFNEVVSQLTLPPQQAITYSETWNQTPTTNQPVSLGTYAGEALLVGCLTRDNCYHENVDYVVFELVP